MTEDDYTLDLPTRIERRKRALKARDIAEFLNISGKQVYALVQQGRIPSYRIDGAIRFDPATTARWLRSRAA